MTIEEKRKHSRIHSMHLLNYLYFDRNGNDAAQGMGRTLNVSESGILLETHTSLDVGHIVSLTIGIEEDVVDIRGRIVYNQKNDRKMFEAGIEFFETTSEARKVLKRYIEAFNAREGRQ